MAECVGIDVSKATLDVATWTSGEHWTTTQSEGDIRTLVERLRALAPQVIVLEASGGYEAVVASELALAGLPVAVVNPRQVRDFAKAMGQLAKTDALDGRSPNSCAPTSAGSSGNSTTSTPPSRTRFSAVRCGGRARICSAPCPGSARRPPARSSRTCPNSGPSPIERWRR